MLADDLDKLAEWLEDYADHFRKQGGDYYAQGVSKAAEVRTMAERVRGKVLVRPFLYQLDGGMVMASLGEDGSQLHPSTKVPNADAALEALQAKLDEEGA